MIDTHSHLDGEEFADDLDDVILRAQAAGVERILVPAINAHTLPHLLDICDRYPDYLSPMIGLHPEEVNSDATDVNAELAMIEERLETDAKEPRRFVAVGEVGLDFYWDDTHRDLQKSVFERQIEFALRYDLPLMIHARSAHGELVDILARHDNPRLRGVFHCFTGTADEAAELLAFPNFMLGIGGVLTFKKSTLAETLQNSVPISRIVLETDSPYMAPVPHRGQRNESAFVSEVAARLAEIYKCTIKNVDKITSENAKTMFGLSQSLDNHKNSFQSQ